MNIHEENSLSVRLFGIEVGVLAQTQKAKLHFAYTEEAPYAISHSLPLKEKSFEHNRCYPYFAGLAPEGERSLPLLSRILGVNQNDCFNMLKILGFDCIGAVSFHQMHDPIVETVNTPLKGEPISEKDLEKKMHTLPQAPLFYNTPHVQVALSGNQYKAAICLIDGQVAIPDQHCFSTHIFKPGLPPFENTLLNEYFCMRLAKRLHIPVANVSLYPGQKTPYLLIERFDRQIHGSKIKHIHQEDFCQALGMSPACKYQQEGGPSIKACFGLIQKSNVPALDRNHFMKILIYNFLIGNYQAHGKDFTIQYLTHKQFQLAPFYDLHCSVIEGNLNQMAMKIGGIYEHDDIQAIHWQKLCEKRGFSYPAFKTMMQQQTDTILFHAKEERLALKEAGFETHIADKIIEVIERHCQLTKGIR